MTLVPGGGGTFDVSLGDRQIFSKKDAGRFPTEGEVLGRLAAMLKPPA